MRRAFLVALVVVSTGCSRRGVAVTPPAENPQAGLLYANLWVQQSAEYSALCRQIYRNAEDVILDRLRRGRFAKPPAVVLDLDETVIDNSGFQTWLHRNRLTYSSERWARWERWQAAQPTVAVVPGAVELLRAVADAGATPVYISNRREDGRAHTVEALVKLGLLQADDPSRLLLRTDTSSKSARRERVAESWTIVALFGDNLADFHEIFEASAGDLETRNARVAEHAERWGVEWFVLPNPTYGDWERPLGPDLEGALIGPADLSLQ
jgi:5'-nucleotidase (lipoprotein e(P4) family)